MKFPALFAVIAVFALPALSLPNSAQAQTKGAYMLQKVQTAEDVQKIDAGDTIVMSCPKCKETSVQVVEKSFHAATPDQLKTMSIHLCSSCDTKFVTTGEGRQAKSVLVHTCKACGSEDVTCCVMKKGSSPTPGMVEDKK